MKFRIRKSLYDRVLDDLRRPHPFALERVGFLTAKLGNRRGSDLIVFLADYIAVPDNQYINDRSVGARMNSDAIRAAMQHILNTQDGLFHVHLHDWSGIPELGYTDRMEIPPIVNSFCNVGPSSAHGIVLLSSDKAMALAWPPSSDEPVPADRITVVGYPLMFLEMDDE